MAVISRALTGAILAPAVFGTAPTGLGPASTESVRVTADSVRITASGMISNRDF